MMCWVAGNITHVITTSSLSTDDHFMTPQRKNDAGGPSGPSRFGQGSTQAIVAESGGPNP